MAKVGIRVGLAATPDGHHDRIHDKHYLKRTRPSISQLVRDVQADCLSAGLKPPHRRMIVARLEDVDLRKRARSRGEHKIEKATTAVPGTFRPARPLEVVQIDHTRADVSVVDKETREPIGRPWLTLAMDVYSRMVTGFYLTMDAPSWLSTSLCLLHPVFDKSAWLKCPSSDNLGRLSCFQTGGSGSPPVEVMPSNDQTAPDRSPSSRNAVID